MIPENQDWPTMEAKEVAALLGWTPETFSRRKKELIAQHGMPAPLPSRLYWRASVMRWFETYGEKRAASLVDGLRKSIASLRIDNDKARLEAKYVARNAA